MISIMQKTLWNKGENSLFKVKYWKLALWLPWTSKKTNKCLLIFIPESGFVPSFLVSCFAEVHELPDTSSMFLFKSTIILAYSTLKCFLSRHFTWVF